MTIETVAPGQEDYNDLEEFVNIATNRFNYAEFAQEFNKAELDAILVFEYPSSSMSNFDKILKTKGLSRHVDYGYRATAANTGAGSFKVVLKKLTNTDCK